MSFGLEFDVRGIQPAPKGSYKPVRRPGGRGVVLLPASQREKPWRQAVALKGRQAMALADLATPPKSIPLAARIAFHLPKPKTVTRTLPTVPPDLDKLLRATLDGLADGRIIADDSQIVRLAAVKEYAPDPSQIGASILISEVK